MNIRSNRYNDPALGEAFNNIASIFAPPSAQDMAGYATANVKKGEAERASAMFAYANDPNYSREQAERMAFATGLVNGTNGYYAQDQNNATAIRAQDVTASTSRANNAADNTRATITSMFQPLNPDQVRPEVPADIAGTQGLPGLAPTFGAPKPLSLDESKALTYGGMSQELQEAITFGSTPIEQTLREDGSTQNVTILDALGQTPAPDTSAAAVNYQNYTVAGADGKTSIMAGRALPDGRILSPSGEDISTRVLSEAGTGGGMSLEVDGQGGVRLNTGGANTVATQTRLQDREMENERAAKEIVALFGTLRADDLGVRGAVNETVRTNIIGQVNPGAARPDVAARRNQLRASSANLAAAIMNDSRLSDSERALARQVSVSDGLDVSLPGAQAQLAQLAVLTLWQAEAARAQQAGVAPPNRDAAFVGMLVDRGDLPAELAQLYMQNMGSTAPAPQPAGNAGAVTTDLPVFSTPEEAAAQPSGTRFRTPDGREKVVP